MSKLLDNICKIRDLVNSKDYSKLKFHQMTMLKLKEEIHRQMSKKVQDYNHQLEFTSQDLRELAQDIRSLLKRWETAMSPEKNIKGMAKNTPNNKINFENYTNTVIPIMVARAESISAITELLNIAEYHGVYLYYLEIASNDDFAINFTERLIK